MSAAALEADRVADLHALTDPDARQSEQVELFVERAAQIAGVPMATLNLLDSTRQCQAATTGFEGRTSARSDAMCSVTLELGSTVVVADARNDPRFESSPWVDGRLGGVRFYASAPLTTQRGHVIGTLCVFDIEPHELTAGQTGELEALAVQIVETFEHEAAARR